MKMNKLGNSGIEVSALCLGSMTWGTQNSEAEGHAQIDAALDAGINFIDTAEMYPVNPLTKETQGDTERVIGSWVAHSGRREDVVLATKVAGAGYRNVRDGAPISRKTILSAFEQSLKSMQTDYIDLYQLHWPNRGSFMFRQNWTFDPRNQDGGKAEFHDHIADVLTTLDELVEAGKLRAIGLSNESAWGTSQWLRIAEENNLPRMVSIQNEYSLTCRLFEPDLAELCVHENVGLLSYSPLATGLLSGKYHDGQVPSDSRGAVAEGLGGRMKGVWVYEAADAYVDVAHRHDLDPCQMALAWAMEQPFMASVIFGATKQWQVENALKAQDLTLTDEAKADILEVYRRYPMPF